MQSPNDIPFPTIPDDLLAALDKRFPHRNPTPETTIERIMFSAGARHVIEFLTRIQAERKKPSWPEE